MNISLTDKEQVAAEYSRLKEAETILKKMLSTETPPGVIRPDEIDKLGQECLKDLIEMKNILEKYI